MNKIDELLMNEEVEWKKLGEVCEIVRGVRVTKKNLIDNGQYPVVSGGIGYMGYINQYNRYEDTITIAQYGTAGYVCWQKQKFWANDVCFSVYPNNEVVKKYLYHFLLQKQEYLYLISNKSAVPYSISKEKILKIEIPIPSIETQEKIVKILDTFTNYLTELQSELQSELQYRTKQYEYYREKLLTFDVECGSKQASKQVLISRAYFDLLKEATDVVGVNLFNVKFVKLDDLLEYEQPTKYIVKSTEYSDSYKTPVLTAGKTFILGYTDEKDNIYKADRYNPVIIFDDFTSGNHWVDFDFKIKSSAMKILKPNGNINFRYCYYYMQTINVDTTEHKRLWISQYSQIEIPVPSIQVQEYVVSVLDKFETLINDISTGIPKEIELRQKQYEYYREKLLNFKR